MYRNSITFIVLFLSVLNVGSANTTISYLYKNHSIDQISNTNEGWVPYREGMNEGLNNGVYWFKIEMSPSSEHRFIRVPEAHITRSNLFLEGLEINKLKSKRYVTYKVLSSNKKKTYYLKVNCLLEAKTPIEVLDIDTYYSINIKESVFMALYYGVVLVIILLNLFSYINFKNDSYLFYIFMVFGMAINAFYKDGLVAYLFGHEGPNEVMESYISLVIVIAAIFFTKSFLGIDNKYFRVRKLGVYMTFLCGVSAITFHITRNFSVFIITHILELLTLNVFLLYGLFLWKRSMNARFFSIAYGFPLLVAHDFYLSPYFGFSLFKTSFILYKFGSLTEMIIFTYAIFYFAKELSLKNREYRAKIEAYAKELKMYNSETETVNLEELLAKKYNFTAAEIKILKLISKKYTNKIIADKSFISENTVKFHIKNIYNKLNVKNRSDARSLYDGLK
ncbi:7TM diverse intracellular signaling domain-containing protein [Bacteroidota bacterium]